MIEEKTRMSLTPLLFNIIPVTAIKKQKHMVYKAWLRKREII